MNTATKSKTDTENAKDIDAVTEEINKLRADLGSLVDTVGKIGKDRLGNKATESLARGEEALAGFTGELQRIENDITASTRSSPWRALGIAAFVGLLAGLILRR